MAHKHKTPKTQDQMTNKQKNEPFVISVCIIHRDVVTMRWAENFRRLEIPAPSTCYSIGNLYHDVGREILVRHAIKTDDPEWIFFLDTGILPPANAIPRLIQIAKEQDIPVLSGLCWLKNVGSPNGTLEEEYTPMPSAFTKVSEDPATGAIVYNSIVDQIKPFLDKNSVCGVDAVGMGCCLIKADIFKQLDKSNPNKPYFQFGTHRKDENTGVPLLQCGEDIYFCNRLTSELGIKPYVSTEIKCDHIFYPTFSVRRGSDGKLVI